MNKEETSKIFGILAMTVQISTRLVKLGALIYYFRNEPSNIYQSIVSIIGNLLWIYYYLEYHVGYILLTAGFASIFLDFIVATMTIFIIRRNNGTNV
jgi:hypothetical protein